MKRLPLLFGAAASVILSLAACSSGGDEERPQSQVRINADHHFFGFIGRPEFGDFPVAPNDTGTLRSLLRMLADSTYSIFDDQGTIASSDYFLEEDGRFSILIPTSGATQVYRGAYGLDSDTAHLFLADRIGETVGLYFGTERVDGTPDLADLEDSWHMFALNVIYSSAGTLPTPDGVGRAFAGSIDLSADGSLTGSGVDSTTPGAVLPVSGDPGALAGFDAWSFDLDMTFGQGPSADMRSLRGGGTDTAIFLADGEENGGTAGLMAMMRHRSAGAVDLQQLAGDYVLGLLTLFIDPTRMGTDAAVGTLELSENGDFRIEATNNTGDDFSYRGTFVAEDDGTLTFSVAGTSEEWQGAFDDDYATVIFADTFKETRTGGAAGIIELSLGMAIRENQP